MSNELLIHNAEEKLKRESKSEDPYEPATMIQKNIVSALVSFCRQEPDIAKAIIDTNKKFSDCCKEILKDTKAARYIPDFEAYRRALKFYIPEFDIECSMTVKRKGENKDVFKLSLLDLLGD